MTTTPGTTTPGTTGPVDRRWPWGVAGAALALTVTATPLAVANATVSGVEGIYIGDALAGAVVPAAGALVVSRVAGQRVGWVLLSTVGLAVSFFLSEWSSFGLHTRPGSLPLAVWAGWLAEIAWVPFLAVLTLLPLWFPTGRVPSRAWLPLQVAVLGLLGLLLVACVLHPTLEDGTPSPLGPVPAWAADARDTLTLVLVLSSLACLASLVVRYVRAGRTERLRLRWLALAAAVAVGVVLLPGVPVTVADVLTGLAFALVAAAVTAAVLGGLYGIDGVVNRSLVYAIASAATYLLYVVVVTATGAVLPEAAGFVGIAAVALAFAPARALTTRAVDRVLHGTPSDPLATLATLGEHLDAPAREATTAAVTAVRETLSLPWVAVTREDGEVLAAAGERPPGASTTEVPMTVHGHGVGRLVVARRPGEGRPDDRDAALLGAVARTLAGAVHAAELSTDLQRARERLVLAQQEERRRLHRDLHDGLGPVLSHAVLALDGVRHEIGADPPGLAAVKENLQHALTDLRRLVQGLRPPALDDVGLAGALAKHVGLLRASGPAVVLAADDVPEDLPAAVEVAAYRIATEALANVTRHAGATRCELRLVADGDDLVVTVADDGRGLTGEPGVGLTSLRERAEELGGTLRITDGGPGTVVTARLPVRDVR